MLVEITQTTKNKLRIKKMRSKTNKSAVKNDTKTLHERRSKQFL